MEKHSPARFPALPAPRHAPSRRQLNQLGVGFYSLIFAVFSLAPLGSDAAPAVWNDGGSDFNWSTAGNWTSNAAPSNGDDLEFSFHITGAPETIHNDYLTNPNSIAFNNQSFVLDSNAITLGAGGIVNSSSKIQTLSFGGTGITLGASQAWTDNGLTAQSQIKVTSNVDLNGMTLNVDGAKNTTLSGVISGTTGSGLIKDGAGTLFLTHANTFTGTTTLIAGGLLLNNNTALGSSTLQINGGTLGSNNTGTELANAISVSGDFSLMPANTGSKQLILDGDMNLGEGTRTLTGLIGANGTVIFNGSISSGGMTFNASNPLSLFVLGGSTSNSYSGLTTVNSNSELQLTKTGGAIAVAGDLLINSGGVVFQTGNEQIADTATVTVNSTGNRILAGWNLTSGTETIGTLLGNGSVSLDNHVNTAGKLILAAGNFSGVISDGGFGGQLVKTTPGALILAGINPYTGDTTINGGLLQVDGSIASANTWINAGGTLGGIGSIGGNVINAGNVSPGHSPGTLSLTGNYTQTAAGTWTEEIASNSSFDHLAVGGTANLSGTLSIVRLNNFIPTNGTLFTILTSGSGRVGTFSSVLSGFANSAVKVQLFYNPNDVTLEFLSNFTGVPNLTPNQSTVAAGLTAGNQNPGLQSAINYLMNEPQANLPGDFDRIAPEELNSIFTINFSSADVQNANLERHLEQLRNGASGFTSIGFTATSKDGKTVDLDGQKVQLDQKTLPIDNRWSCFIEGAGEFSKVGNTNNASGYDFTTAGITLGSDYRVNDHFSIGISGNYANSDAGLVNQGGIHLNSGKGGIYATIYGSGFYADALVRAGYNSYNTNRAGLLGYASGNASGTEFDTLFNGGYDFHHGNWSCGPIASLAFTQIRLNHFSETGSLLPLEYPNQSQSSLRSNLGAKISYTTLVGSLKITPQLRASWQHEYLDSTQSIGAQFSGGSEFTIHGPAVGGDSALLSAGISVQITPTLSLYTYYDGQLGRQNFHSNNISGGVKIEF